MAETVAIEADGMGVEERRAADRRKAAMAARLLACCLGIPAEPAFDLADPAGRDCGRFRDQPYGDGLYKDLLDLGCWGGARQVQLRVLDECGRVKAESRRLYSLGQAVELLERLPLPLFPRAGRWLRDALGETRPVAARPSPGTARPLRPSPGKE